MRRIYDSDAVVRDDHPHTPTGRERDGGRTVDWAAASHAFMPVGLRDRAVTLRVETDRETYPVGRAVGIRVTLRNRLPVPVRLRTRSPVLWRWGVDDIPEASRLERPAPEGKGAITFARRERKTFERRWNQSIQETDREWRPVEPGEHVVAAWVNVDDPAGRGLRDETTVTIAST